MTALEQMMAEAERLGRPPCTCFQVRRMSRAITQMYDDAFRDTGLRSTQFTLLLGVGAVGKEGIGAIAERLDMDRTTLSRNLKPLIKKGLVEEIPGEDARVHKLRLTPAGLEMIEAAWPVWQGVQQRLRDALKPEQAEMLPEISDAIVALSQGE
jgi:DNA-binding MarR family transcriptional regulator